MKNDARGVVLRGLTALILACAIATPVAAVEVQTPTVHFQSPKIRTTPPPTVKGRQPNTKFLDPSLTTFSPPKGQVMNAGAGASGKFGPGQNSSNSNNKNNNNNNNNNNGGQGACPDDSDDCANATMIRTPR